MGAIASKKASADWSVSARMASASAGEVRGPVATMTLDQSGGGRPAISRRSIVMRGWASSRAVTSAENGIAVDREGAAGGERVAVGGGDDEAACGAHLPVEEADGVLLVVVRAEGVRADELGQRVGLVREGAGLGAHLVQDDGDAELGGLPGGLGAGEAAADDVDGIGLGHGADLGQSGGEGKRGRPCGRRRGNALTQA